jgi:hypothetical protein
MTVTKVRPYRVKESGRSLDDLRIELNDQLYQNYGADYRFGGVRKIVVGSLFDYEELLASLAAIPHAEFVTHHEMAASPCPPDKLRIGIRHDVDADIVAAEDQAELEHKYGVRASWYILHTAPYYGVFQDGVFVRNGCLAPVYQRFEELGHEVALHTDPLGVYQQHGVDGAEALVTEVQWLRSLGLNIRGTVAHNSKPVYGAWNYEIFKGRFDPKDQSQDAPDHVVHEGRWAPLRVLDEAEIGLEYEGNEVLWQKHTPLEYGATRSVNRWRWVAHTRRIRANPDAPELPFADQARMIDDIQNLSPGRFVVLVVHPCYYGARAQRHQGPPRRLQDVTAVHDEKIGWFTYDPDRMQSTTDTWRTRQTFQTINHPNERGMLDRPWPSESDQQRTILILGGDNVDGATVPIPEHATTRLEELMETGHVVKLAFPGMGTSRLWSWYERMRDDLRPDDVVIGVGHRAVRWNHPALWSRADGVSWEHPPGDYLGWDDDRREIVVVPASSSWKSHLMPRCSILDESIEAHEFLIACYKYLCDRVRQSGARPWLFVESLGADRVLTSIESIAAACDVPLINPYERFDAQTMPVEHEGDSRWNATGHRLASESLYEALASTTCVKSLDASVK